MNSNKSIYLPGLNGIRAIAALGVLCSHVNLALGNFSIRTFSFFGFINNQPSSWNLGEQGVTMFFVLSGFLITYLLIHEKRKSLKVSLKKFYQRRILRIWPLYFFYLILLLFILYAYNNYSPEIGTVSLYLFLLANIPFLIGQTIPAASHFWSIAVEEQFYLFWPLLFRFKEESLEKFLIIMIPLMIGARILLWLWWPFQTFTNLFTINRFDCMMFGGLLAISVLRKNKIYHFLEWKIVRGAAWIIILVSVLNTEILNSIIQMELITFATGVIICEQISNKKPILNLENKFLNFLGRYSFGIYVYHPLVLFLFHQWNIFSFVENEILKSCLILCSVISFTIIISYFSYEYFELHFIKLKSKFSIVHSSNVKTKSKI